MGKYFCNLNFNISLTAGSEPGIFHYVQTASGKTEFHPNGSLVIREVEQGDEGHYRCEVQNGVGELSKTVRLDVQGEIPGQFSER